MLSVRKISKSKAYRGTAKFSEEIIYDVLHMRIILCECSPPFSLHVNSSGAVYINGKCCENVFWNSSILPK